MAMCKECDWPEGKQVVLHKCDCGNAIWIKGATQTQKEHVVYRCTKCDALHHRKWHRLHLRANQQHSK